MNNREIVEAVTDELQKHGATEIEYATAKRGHPRIWFTWAGERRWIVLPGSTSDRRAHLNARSEVRKILGVQGEVRRESNGTPKVKRSRAPKPDPECPTITPGPDPWAALQDFNAEPQGFAPGLYFDLDEDAYHAAQALSASSMKWLAVSTMDFWARSWMNEAREEGGSDSDAKTLGSAYHERVLMGRDSFQARYAAKLTPEDHPDALRTADEIRERLKALELPRGGSKADLVARLVEADPQAIIWDTLVSEHEEIHAGKTLLHPDSIARIELAAAVIEKHPDLGKAFSGGAPEVSCFWADPETGVPLKCRFDYLKPRAVTDLKTFSNPLGKPVDKAVAHAVASQRYHLQAAHYLDGAAVAVEHARAGRVFGSIPEGFLERLIAGGGHRFLFVFQQTGIAPLALGRTFERGLVTAQIAANKVRELIRLFAHCREVYGTDPWVEDRPIAAFDDAEFPLYIGD